MGLLLHTPERWAEIAVWLLTFLLSVSNNLHLRKNGRLLRNQRGRLRGGIFVNDGLTLVGKLTFVGEESFRGVQPIYVHDVMWTDGRRSWYVKVKAWRRAEAEEFLQGVQVTPGKVYGGESFLWLYEPGEEGNGGGTGQDEPIGGQGGRPSKSR